MRNDCGLGIRHCGFGPQSIQPSNPVAIDCGRFADSLGFRQKNSVSLQMWEGGETGRARPVNIFQYMPVLGFGQKISYLCKCRKREKRESGWWSIAFNTFHRLSIRFTPCIGQKNFVSLQTRKEGRRKKTPRGGTAFGGGSRGGLPYCDGRGWRRWSAVARSGSLVAYCSWRTRTSTEGCCSK